MEGLVRIGILITWNDWNNNIQKLWAQSRIITSNRSQLTLEKFSVTLTNFILTHSCLLPVSEASFHVVNTLEIQPWRRLPSRKFQQVFSQGTLRGSGELGATQESAGRYQKCQLCGAAEAPDPGSKHLCACLVGPPSFTRAKQGMLAEPGSLVPRPNRVQHLRHFQIIYGWLPKMKTLLWMYSFTKTRLVFHKQRIATETERTT